MFATTIKDNLLEDKRLISLNSAIISDYSAFSFCISSFFTFPLIFAFFVLILTVMALFKRKRQPDF
ncbi:hypothetical protein WQ57_04635 [Mesobacillus campisalis]|uniref:Uncharacterized protein n=1 Tax=Mesobacillus campisalis TaxID=1408103 RepID=A0A0M2SZE6_9BACI|nr:hypothetical protein WQ57_04635 [Mesobacillus campisalis]